MSRRGGGGDSADELARSPWRQGPGGLGCGGEAKKRGAESFFSLLVIAPQPTVSSHLAPKKGWEPTRRLIEVLALPPVESQKREVEALARLSTLGVCPVWTSAAGMTSRLHRSGPIAVSQSVKHKDTEESVSTTYVYCVATPQYEFMGYALIGASEAAGPPVLGFLGRVLGSLGARKRLGQSWKACRVLSFRARSPTPLLFFACRVNRHPCPVNRPISGCTVSLNA
ncbi:hypothetical protein LZ31DRAFT_143774 [Colletotrichum somersetense]|nr:hypothetical protein LZ31DRAFT_143774 [Colletotrichum somersetense]